MRMGIYANYLKTISGFEALCRERKKQLKRISDIRNSEVIVMAAAINKPKSAIEHADLLPISDILDSFKGGVLDVILETPGGSGEVTEEIVCLLRKRFACVNFIIPGTAKSAGTIMVMSGDEILMGELSSLGPIDAQVQREGKSFSAEAFLEGLEKIKRESEEKGFLNRAYIPILQKISPGEIESARNALRFGQTLASLWLNTYKFKHWTVHGTSKEPVSDEDRKQRAQDIAENLGSHSKWLTHARSLKIKELTEMGIQITNYEDNTELSDAIRRYHILLMMSFETNMVKLFESIDNQVYRFLNAGTPMQPPPQQSTQKTALVKIEYVCPNCNRKSHIFGKLDPNVKMPPEAVAFPKTNKFTCPACGKESDLTSLRMQLEAGLRKQIL